MNREDMVREFHRNFDHAVGVPLTDELSKHDRLMRMLCGSLQYICLQHDAICEVKDARTELALTRVRLIAEEFYELVHAMEEGNLIEVADALADLQYVISGCAVAYGIPLEAVFQEVHRSNMTKTPLGKNSKGGKGEGYQPPDIKKCLQFDPME